MKNKIREQLFNYLKTFMIQSNWMDTNTPEQARSVFTTICLYCHLDADTSIVDNMLLELYKSSDLESCEISYDEFDLFMCELIV